MLNQKQAESLKKLEEKIGKKLTEVSLENIMGSSKIYTVDEGGNLIGLNLHRPNLADISFLGDFPRLSHLVLGYNQIIDLSPLRALTNLTNLVLYKNQITDISPLRALINLTRLEREKGRVKWISWWKPRTGPPRP
jgi:internalin A